MPRRSATWSTVAAVLASSSGTPRCLKTRTPNSKSCSGGKSLVSATAVTLALRMAGRLRFGAAVLDPRNAIGELAEPIDRDAHDVAWLCRVRLGRNQRRAGQKPRSD